MTATPTVVLACSVAGALAAGCFRPVPEPVVVPPQSEVTFCHLEVHPLLSNACAKLSLVYAFEVDEVGAPRRVRDLSPAGARGLAQMDLELVEQCLTGWRFPGLKEGTQVLALFRWGWGSWKTLTVSGGGFRTVIEAGQVEHESG